MQNLVGISTQRDQMNPAERLNKMKAEKSPGIGVLGDANEHL